VFSQLGIRLPADLAARLKAFSLSSGLSQNAIAATALTRFLDQEKSVRPPR
jgi:predicted transcriptional regulator